MSYIHWRHFLAIESDLEITSRYVEFSPRNYATYSVEFTKLLLASSSEVDVVAKALCHKVDSSRPHRNINHYRATITKPKHYPKFHTIEITLPRYNICFKPWQEWGHDENPDWWKAYNDVKHHRDTAFREASLKNTILSVAGLFALVLYYYQKDLNEPDFFWPAFPKLMLTKGAPDLLWTGQWSLPDFP